MYSVERWPGNPAVGVGRDSYRTDNDLFFWYGQYYVSILSLDSDDAVRAAQLAIARTLEGRLKDSGETLWGFEVLPKEARQEDTVQYFQVDAMSIDFMTDTFTAEYGEEDDTVRRFLSRQKDAATATTTLDKYAEYLKAYGDDLRDDEVDGLRIISADFGGGYIDAAFAQGAYVGGVTAVQGRERAVASARALAKALAKK